MKKLSDLLLVISLLTYASVFGLNLSFGLINRFFNLLQIDEFMYFFFPFIIQSLVLITSLVLLFLYLFKYKNTKINKSIYVSTLSSSIFVGFFIYIWLIISINGLH